MAGWFLFFFENTQLNEAWAVIIINGFITIVFSLLSLRFLKRNKYTKQGIMFTTVFGGVFGLIWAIATGLFLLYLCKDVIWGTKQGDWIFVLRLTGFSRSIIGETIYSFIMGVLNYFTYDIIVRSNVLSFMFLFSPSFVLGFVSGSIGCLVTAISLWLFQNKTVMLPKFIMVLLLFLGIFTMLAGFSFVVFHQALILASG